MIEASTVEQVLEHTGRSLDEWAVTLDEMGASALKPRELRETLRGTFRLRNPWHAIVAVDYESRQGIDPTNRQRNGQYRVYLRRDLEAPPQVVFRAFTAPSGFAAWVHHNPIQELATGLVFPVLQSTLKITDIFEFPSAGYVRLERHHDDGVAITHLSIRSKDNKTRVEFAESKLPDASARDASRSFWESILIHLAHAVAEASNSACSFPVADFESPH